MFDLTQICVFRCLCYIFTITANRKKFDHRAKIGIFLDFKPNTQIYIVYDLWYHGISVVRNVILYEVEFPYTKFFEENKNPSLISLPIHRNNQTTYVIDFMEINTKMETINNHNIIEIEVDNTKHESIIDQTVLKIFTRDRVTLAYFHDFSTTLASCNSKVRYPIKSFISLVRLFIGFK